MLSERLVSARKRAGLSQRQLAAEMGGRYERTMISHVETGKSGFVGEGLTRVAEVLGVSIDYLFGLTNDPTPISALTQAVKADGTNSPGVAMVPLVSTIVGDVRGRGIYDETIVDILPLPKRWLTDRGVSADHCHLVGHKGAWMEPKLPDGCIILVDIASKEFRDDSIFLLQFEEQIMDKTAKYLTPVRLLWEPRVIGADEEHWRLKFDDEERNIGPIGWRLNYFDLKRVIGEVVMVVSSP